MMMMMKVVLCRNEQQTHFVNRNHLTINLHTFGSQLLPGSLSSGGFTSGLFSTSHCD